MPAFPARKQDAQALGTALLEWYQARRRKLPWREQTSLYRTVVSEFMLQQTQIKTALPYFERWLLELPDFESLAKAPEQKVLKLWEGLGYYTRARNLRKLAIELVGRTEIPREAEDWLELPGIGPYSAAAITSIAFGSPAACVDGNVVRILARLSDDSTSFRDSATAAKAFRPLAETLLNLENPGDHNQAMMELGATVCLKHRPECLLCPVAAWCQGQKSGKAAELPRLESKRMEDKVVQRAWCVREGALLLHEAKTGARRLAGLHELPEAEALGLNAREIDTSPLLATRRRGITRFRITEYIRELPAPHRTPPAHAWVTLSQLETVAMSGPHRRWIREILKEKGL